MSASTTLTTTTIDVAAFQAGVRADLIATLATLVDNLRYDEDYAAKQLASYDACLELSGVNPGRLTNAHMGAIAVLEDAAYAATGRRPVAGLTALFG